MIEPRARIRWLPPSEGGRADPPPGPTYSTVARFERAAGRWLHEAWSIVLTIDQPAGTARDMVAVVRMLAEADAPKELLEPGSKFELYEGRRCVARGEIL